MRTQYARGETATPGQSKLKGCTREGTGPLFPYLGERDIRIVLPGTTLPLPPPAPLPSRSFGSEKQKEKHIMSGRKRRQRQDKTDNKTIRDATGQSQTRHDKTSQHKTIPDKTRPNKTRQDGAGQDKTGQDKTRPDRAGQNQTGQDKRGQDKTGQTNPDWAEQAAAAHPTPSVSLFDPGPRLRAGTRKRPGRGGMGASFPVFFLRVFSYLKIMVGWGRFSKQFCF